MNIFRHLLYTLLVFLTTYATAEITIDGNAIHVETNNYKVRFDYGAITFLHNKLTNETHTLPFEPIFETHAAILGREYFAAHQLDNVKTDKTNDHTAETRFREGGTEIRLVIAIEPNTEDLLITLDGVTDTPGVSAIQWGIDNLDLVNLRANPPSKTHTGY